MVLQAKVFVLLVAILPFALSKEIIVVTSDEPVILGSKVTFTAILKRPEQPTYDIAWQELTLQSYRHHQAVLSKDNGYQSNWTLDYPSNPAVVRPGTYATSASVSYKYFYFIVNVGTVVTNFNLTRDFTGSLDVFPSDPKKKNPSYVSTLNETELLANVHDPYDYLKTAESVTYSWFNQTGFIVNTTLPNLKLNLTQVGNYSFNVTLTALYKDTERNGVFGTDVTAKVPITNLTVSGNTWIPQTQLLNLLFKWDGSKPYSYCFDIVPDQYNLTGNESCSYAPTVTNDSEIPLVSYFDIPGIKAVIIILENDVSRVVNLTLVNVYKVNPEQIISSDMIVPISFSILIVLLMIISCIAYLWLNRAKISVKVAEVFHFGSQTCKKIIKILFRSRITLGNSSAKC